MRDLLKRIHPVSSATADPADDPAGRPFRLRRGTTVRRWDGLDGFSQPRRGQIRTARGTEGRWIRHAGTLALSVLALAVAMIVTSPGCLLVTAVGLAALETAGFFAAARAAILLATITMTAEIKHHTAGGKTTNTLTKDCGAGRRHRSPEEALDNRHRS